VTMDWWTDVAEEVDSVVFWIPSYEALWTESLHCLSNGFGYRQAAGIKNSNHWQFIDQEYGYVSYHPLTNLYVALEFIPDSLAKALVYFGGGRSVTFDAEPVTE
jgi:hypothetical protein